MAWPLSSEEKGLGVLFVPGILLGRQLQVTLSNAVHRDIDITLVSIGHGMEPDSLRIANPPSVSQRHTKVDTFASINDIIMDMGDNPWLLHRRRSCTQDENERIQQVRLLMLIIESSPDNLKLTLKCLQRECFR